MSLDYEFMRETFIKVLKAVPVTLNITAVVLLVSVPIALLLAILNLQHRKVLTPIFQVYLSFVRGVPMILLIFLIYSAAPGMIAAFCDKLHLSLDVYRINYMFYAYLIYSFVTIANLAEVFRSALLTIPKSQIEAAHGIGINTFQAYIHIILPQMWVAVLPVLCNTVINLIKNTSLVFVMTIQDITGTAKIAAVAGYKYIEAYLDIFLIYILVCGSIELVFKCVEKRAKRYRTVQVK